ncbi:MAG: succinate dehydrogenase, cytochrome b556 subunit [Gammaproteobacteria bacterium]
MQDTREALADGRASDGATVRRPLSPHLQIYRPQITSGLSIFHRLTGIWLGVGTLLLVSWLVALASGAAAFAAVQAFVASIIGMILLFLWTLALLFHLCNGMRHLAWDSGFGFGSWTSASVSRGRTIYHSSGWAVVAVAVAATIAIWVVGAVAG